jgi:anti-anti-sigma factor
MRLKFWGTRGSIPAPLRPDQVEQKIFSALREAGRKNIDLTNTEALQALSIELTKKLMGSTVGGNTTCITIELDEDLIIFDAGSGIRELGEALMDPTSEFARKYRFYEGQGHAYIFFTHTHWDHIQGLPFFKPLHVPGNNFDIYHVHKHVPQTLARQMEAQFFPLSFDLINATLVFHKLEEDDQITIANATITNTELKHPGRAYAYRVVADNAIAIVATDGEYKSLDYASTAKYCNFYANADVLIFDAMFSVRESFVKEDWGHSSALIGADIAREANVKSLYLFHHDPISTDGEIKQILQQTKEYLSQNKGVVPEVHIACEGLELTLANPTFMSDFYMKDHLEKDVVLMTLSGRFGAHAIDRFRKHLAHSLQVHQTDKVILQLENLSDLTMAGIRALVDARRSVVSLALVGMPTNVYRILELAGTTDFFAIYDSADEALLALNQHNYQNNKK